MATRTDLTRHLTPTNSGGMSRRDALRGIAMFSLGAGAATVLAACGQSSPGSGPGSGPGSSTDSGDTSGPGAGTKPIPGRGPDTPRGSVIQFAGPKGQLRGSWAAPTGQPKGAVLLAHDEQGMTEHYDDLVGRFAGLGYATLCVDLLSSIGGTQALADAGQAPAAARAVPLDLALTDMRAGLDELGRRAPARKIGVVGFGTGGALVWQLLIKGDPRIVAAVDFYGAAPEKPDFSHTRTAVLALYAEKDKTVNATQDSADQSMLNANLDHFSNQYEEVDHGFFDDTDPRYNADAAAKAWQATVDWLAKHL